MQQLKGVIGRLNVGVERLKGGVGRIWLIIAALLVICWSFGCSSTKKQLRKAVIVLDAHPKERAEYCASKYIPKESTKTTIKYLPGKPVKTTHTEYVTVDCDSVKTSNISKPGVSNIVRVPIPVYIQVDTASILQEIDRENVAALAAKDIEIADKTAQLKIAYVENEKMKSSRDKWRGWLGYHIGVDIGLILLLCYLWYQKRKIAAMKAAGKLFS